MTERKDQIEVAKIDWLSKHSGLSVEHVFLIEHYSPDTITDYSLVRSLPADWYERWTRARAGYIEMLELRLALAQALELAGQL